MIHLREEPGGGLFWVIIDDVDEATGYHAWTEQQWSSTPGNVTTLVELVGGRTGTIAVDAVPARTPAIATHGGVFGIGTYCQLQRTYFNRVNDWVYVICTPEDTFLALTRTAISARSISLITLTTLNGAIDAGQTTMTVNSVAAMEAGLWYIVTINSERIKFQKPTSGLVVTIERGVGGTTAATHADGASVVWQKIQYGSGEVELYTKQEMAAGTPLAFPTGQVVTVYNECDAIAINTFVRLEREPYSGDLFAIERCALDFIEGSGSGEPVGLCPCLTLCFTVTFPGVTDFGCTDCEAFTDTIVVNSYQNDPIAMQQRFIEEAESVCCVESEIISDCGVGFPEADKPVYVFVRFALGGAAYLTVGGLSHNGYHGVLKRYAGTWTDWDCQSPLTLTVYFNPDNPDIYGQCDDWPNTITLTPCEGGGGGTDPTVSLPAPMPDICEAAATFTFTGTNISTTPGNNILILSSGTATCTASTATSGTGTFTSQPSLGAFGLTLENEFGSSGEEVQVGTVVDCGTPGWLDHFTDTNGVNITAHTPDTSPLGSGYTVLSGGFNIQGNKLNGTSTLQSWLQCDPIAATGTGSITFVLNAGNNTAATIELDPRVDAVGPAITVNVALNRVSGDNFDLTVFDGTLTDTNSVTLLASVLYTLTVVDDGTTVTATVNSVSSGITTSVGFGNTNWVLLLEQSVAGSVAFDDLTVTP